MDKPLCRICKGRHNSDEAHQWVEQKTADLSHLAPKSRQPAKRITITEGALKAQTAAQRQALWRKRNRDKHAELQKAHRAKIRASKPKGEDDGPHAA